MLTPTSSLLPTAALPEHTEEAPAKRRKITPSATLPAETANHLMQACVNSDLAAACQILRTHSGGFTDDDAIALCHQINAITGRQTARASDDPTIYAQCNICFLIAQRLLESTSDTSALRLDALQNIEANTDPTFVHGALSNGVTQALRGQVDINRLQTCFGSYAITAAKFGFTDLIASLTQAGADWRARDEQNHRPTHYANTRGHTEFTK